MEDNMEKKIQKQQKIIRVLTNANVTVTENHRLAVRRQHIAERNCEKLEEIYESLLNMNIEALVDINMLIDNIETPEDKKYASVVLGTLILKLKTLSLINSQ
jgi:hypothetical protein